MKLAELHIFLLSKYMICSVSCDSSILDDGNLTIETSGPKPVFVKKTFVLDPKFLNKTGPGHPKRAKGKY